MCARVSQLAVRPMLDRESSIEDRLAEPGHIDHASEIDRERTRRLPGCGALYHAELEKPLPSLNNYRSLFRSEEMAARCDPIRLRRT